MTTISVAASAALEIGRRIQSGELEVVGIMVRDSATKKIRYILRGMGELPTDPEKLKTLGSMNGLGNVLTVQQMLGAVTVAQNLAIAASLRRIEAKLDAIDCRLQGMEQHLVAIGHTAELNLNAIRSSAISRLKAARSAAVLARRTNDLPTLRIAAKDAEQSAHELLAFAGGLVRREEKGIPIALRFPDDLANLMESAAAAMMAASAIYLSLGAKDAAASLMHEVADATEKVRGRVAVAIRDPEFMIRRIEAGLADDAAIAEAGARLRFEQQWTRAHAVEVETGNITAGPNGIDVHIARPVEGICFQETNTIDQSEPSAAQHAEPALSPNAA